MTERYQEVTGLTLKKTCEEWQMTSSEFASLLCVSPGTFKGWLYGRPIPSQVQSHVRSISNLRLIYDHWDKIAQSIVRIGGSALTGESLIEAINQADALAGDHERLWGELFPALKRELD